MTNVAPAKPRSSNLELYRIICMLMIVAHHFVVNSGLYQFILPSNPTAPNSIFLWLFGMWGKTGINCFLLITGYFMCKSQITLQKFLKLILEIYFYKIAIFLVFYFTGHEHFSINGLIQLVMPFWGFNNNFTDCFIVFYLTIPFWNILIRNMTKKQHQLLLLLLLGIYSVLGNIPHFTITFNYVTWFGVIYLISSYISLYPIPAFQNRRLWGLLTVVSIAASMASVVFMVRFSLQSAYFFVTDSNKILPVIVAVSSFLWIKNINIPQSNLINAIGGSTFGVLLIHASSDAMRLWLWNGVLDCIGHYSLPLGKLILFSIGAVLAVFTACTLIDRLRIILLEKPLFSLLQSDK